MGTNPNEVSESGGSSDEPSFVEVTPGTFVAQNEDQVYEEPDWEWAQASQFIEGGM